VSNRLSIIVLVLFALITAAVWYFVGAWAGVTTSYSLYVIYISLEMYNTPQDKEDNDV